MRLLAEGCMMTCRCVSCGECLGSGFAWVDFWGRHLGARRCDDLDELVRCEECGGSGLSEECDECVSCEDEVDGY